MHIRSLLSVSEKFIVDNAPTILTGVGVVGTVGTAVLTGRASWKAAKILEWIDRDPETGAPITEPDVPATNKEKLKAVLPLYLPAVATGATTVVAIVFAQKINAQRLAALAAVYALSDGKLKDYKSKVEELMGVESKDEVEESIAHDKVRGKELPATVMVVGAERGLFYDSYSARPFYATLNELEAARNKINLRVVNHGHCDLNEWFREIGLEETGYGEEIGWSQHFPFEYQVRPSMSEKDLPMAYVDYETESIRRYNHL